MIQFLSNDVLDDLTQDFFSSGSVRLVTVDPFEVASSTRLPHDCHLSVRGDLSLCGVMCVCVIQPAATGHTHAHRLKVKV